MSRLFRYLKPYRLLAVISPLMMVAEVTCDLLLPYLMSFIVNYGIIGGDISENAVASGIIRFFHPNGCTPMKMTVTFGILMLCVTLVGGFFGTCCAFTAAKASQGFGHDLRRDAYARVMALSVEQTDRFTTGSLVTRMTNDITMVVDLVEALLRHFVRAPIFFIGGTIFLLTLNVQFGYVLLFSLPVLLLTLVIVLSRAVPMFAVVQKKLDRVNCVVQENVAGARVVKASVREDYECARFDVANGELRDVNYRVLRLLAVVHPVLLVVQNAAIIAILLLGGHFIADGVAGMSTGNVMAAVTYTSQVVMSIMMLTMIFQTVSRALASARRVREVLDTEPTITGGGKDAPRGPVAISFKNVSFRYPGTVGAPVLHDINLDVRQGETLAVVGATGAGKSTLARLIPRFYDATEGEVLVDGLPVKEYDLTALRHKIGFMLQKSELFSATAENNIKWSKPEATHAEVEAAAKAAQAAEFVEGLPEGYDSFIAEKGASLSGGQKQRMSIARALVRKPEILILDDATSALDLATEAKLRKSLREELADTTVILIAQRVASVREADRIAVIEDGTIRYCAPHDELLRVSETYREIYASQQKGGAVNE